MPYGVTLFKSIPLKNDQGKSFSPLQKIIWSTCCFVMSIFLEQWNCAAHVYIIVNIQYVGQLISVLCRNTDTETMQQLYFHVGTLVKKKKKKKKNRGECSGCHLKCRVLGAVSIRKTVLPGMAIPMLKIRRPNCRLIFNMEIAIRR